MKTAAYKSSIILIITMGSWLVTNSQQLPDSLLGYLEIAAKNNPAIQQKFSEYQAALQKIPQARSLSDPELSLGVFLKPMELVSGNQVADIRLMQMFPWFGVLRSAKDEMSLMANAKFELFRDAKLQVFYEVQSTWYELYKIRKDISITEKNIDILKIIERLALAKFRAAPAESTGTISSGETVSASSAQISGAGSQGMQSMRAGQGISGPAAANQSGSSMQTGSMGSSSGSFGLAEIYRIQIEQGDLENNAALLENQRSSVTARFNAILNRPSGTQVFTYNDIPIDSLDLSLFSIPDSILANNPMLGMLDYEKQSFEARGKMVERMGYPMVGFGLNYTVINKSPMSESAMNGTDMVMPMISVTLPVYRKKYTAMKTEARMLQTAAAQNYQSTANSLQVEYYQAIQLYRDAQRRVKLYDNQYNLASRSFDLMLSSFKVSSSGLNDVLRIRQQLLDYEFKKAEAAADFNTAAAWLKRLMAFSQIQ
jgi:outer membrane protein TolC